MNENALDYRIVSCGSERAEECLTMRNEILEDLARRGDERLYLVDETDDEFRQFFVDKNSLALGCEVGGELAGCIVSSYRSTPLKRFDGLLPQEAIASPKSLCYMELVQVKKEFRGRGIQRLLMAELERRAVAGGARYMTAIVSPDNLPSLTNFLKSGYREVGRFVYEPLGYDRVKVLKKLAE